MRMIWTKEEMESILIQLNNRFYPFKKYRFSNSENGLVLLGTGGQANVYEVERYDNPKQRNAVKVIGFGDTHVDSKEFRNSVQIQKDLALAKRDVVRIIDYVELRVYIDMSCNVVDVIKVSDNEDIVSEGDFLDLQFIMIEKLIPILKRDKAGNPKLYPKELADFKESEIMKLAHNIGTALERAHEKKLLHRDIKLENVFYDPQKKVYKLGDFGIAKLTDDGMASTVAFTKGYSAPEVVGTDDERYDNTADIYSFGIMLYLLLNELKFPNSENYKVNVTLQYSRGYQFPEPKHKEYGLSTIIQGMCQYDPDERYQSMKDVMNDIEGNIFGGEIQSLKENKRMSYIGGMLCYVLGMIFWKLTYMPELSLGIGIFGYIFLMLGVYKYWLNLKNKANEILSFVILGIGIYLLVSTGFTWLKLAIVLGITFSTESLSGLLSIGIAIVEIISRMMQFYPQIYESMQPYKWIAIVGFSFSFALFFEYVLLKERDMEINPFILYKERYWKVVIVLYLALLINGLRCLYCGVQDVFEIPWITIGNGCFRINDSLYIGLVGVGLGLGWIIRKKMLAMMSK